MRYSTLGKTGLRVSRLALGGSSLGDPRKQISDEQSLLTIKAALDGGVNLIDVSPYYGESRAEQIVGQAIAGVPREQVILATKAGRNGVDAFDFSPTGIRRSVEQSLQRLGTDYIDILQLHDIEYADLNLIIEESLPVLRELKEEGKARFIGVTAYPIKSLQTILKNAEVDTVLSYARYCLSDTALQQLRPLLQRSGVGLMHASPLAMGLLTEQGPFAWHPAPPKMRERCKAAADYCKQYGTDIAQLAIQYALQADWIPTTVVGASCPKLMRQNLAWMDEPIEEELLSDVLALLKPVHNQAWPSGRPENNE